MPIKGLSENTRLPRLGKIRLGTRDPQRGFPRKSDHFVLPQDHSAYQKLVELFGEEPKELRILIPVEEDEEWASQAYKCYNQTYGLVCKGDGEMALRMIDVKTGALPKASVAGTVSLTEISCPGKDCPEYQAKKCGEVMNLKFLIPEVPGLGVWQIDTGSKNSILNINSCAKIIKRAFGRISLIPLKLTFEPIQVNNPEDGKKQTVYVLNLRTDVTLAQLADQAREQSKMFQLEAPDFEALADAQIEKDIDDLWGEKPKVVISPVEITKPETKPEKTQPQILTSTSETSKSTGITEEAGDNLPEEGEAEGEAALDFDPDAPVTPEGIAALDVEMKRAHWDNIRFGKYANQGKGWHIKSKKELTKAQLEEAISDIIADSVTLKGV